MTVLDTKFAAALAGEKRGFGPGGSGAPAVAVKRPPEHPPLRAGDVNLGEADTGGAVGVDLVKLLDGRLLVQGASGAGKSWTLRRLIEQTAKTVQQIIIDPEGEFRGIADTFGHSYIDGAKLDTAALAVVGRRAREHQLSLVIDISDVDREGQMKAFAAVLGALIEAPREQWHPCLVLVDEAHLFAPFGGQVGESPAVRKASISALVDLMSRGRKRGLTGVLATQRLARLSKSVISEAHNFLIGLNTLDLDIRRAAETIGWDARRAFDRLPMLDPGDFVAVGPAFSRSPSVLKVGSIQTRHVGAAPSLPVPRSIDATAAASLLDLDGLAEASAADAAILQEDALAPGTRAIRGFIREKAFPIAGRLWGEIAALAPDGALLAELSQHLEAKPSEIAAAVALLDLYGVVELSGEGKKRAVRVGHGMLP